MARANAEVMEDRSSLLPGPGLGPGMGIAPGLAKGMKGIGPGPTGPIGPIGPMGPIGAIGAISGPIGPISMGPLGPDHGIGHGGGGGIWLLVAGSCDLDSGSVEMPKGLGLDCPEDIFLDIPKSSDSM